MSKHLSAITLLVPDYDQALTFYLECLGFILVEDTTISETKRWVTIAASPTSQTKILLAEAADEQQRSSIGNQSGGRVFLFLETENFYRDFNDFKKKSVVFLEEPRVETYGVVAVFQDPFGNKWDLIQPT